MIFHESQVPVCWFAQNQRIYGMNQPNILIVDDSLIIRKALSRQLEKFGAVVSQAEDGAKGLEESLSGNFDLIITDVEMPHLDGFGLCERLKGHPHTRGIPVIILSSLESDRDIEQGFRVGAAAYVSKSEAQTQLNETIERVLEKSKFHRRSSGFGCGRFVKDPATPFPGPGRRGLSSDNG